MVPDVTVPEGDPNITICIVLSTGITEQVIVTAVTGPKSGAANPATGKSDYSTSGQTLIHIIIDIIVLLFLQLVLIMRLPHLH